MPYKLGGWVRGLGALGMGSDIVLGLAGVRGAGHSGRAVAERGIMVSKTVVQREALSMQCNKPGYRVR
jgi:hypothetical protein